MAKQRGSFFYVIHKNLNICFPLCGSFGSPTKKRIRKFTVLRKTEVVNFLFWCPDSFLKLHSNRKGGPHLQQSIATSKEMQESAGIHIPPCICTWSCVVPSVKVVVLVNNTDSNKSHTNFQTSAIILFSQSSCFVHKMHHLVSKLWSTVTTQRVTFESTVRKMTWGEAGLWMSISTFCAPLIQPHSERFHVNPSVSTSSEQPY